MNIFANEFYFYVFFSFNLTDDVITRSMFTVT